MAASEEELNAALRAFRWVAVLALIGTGTVVALVAGVVYGVVRALAS